MVDYSATPVVVIYSELGKYYKMSTLTHIPYILSVYI